jgi:hypothetical protein
VRFSLSTVVEILSEREFNLQEKPSTLSQTSLLINRTYWLTLVGTILLLTGLTLRSRYALRIGESFFELCAWMQFLAVLASVYFHKINRAVSRGLVAGLIVFDVGLSVLILLTLAAQCHAQGMCML